MSPRGQFTMSPDNDSNYYSSILLPMARIGSQGRPGGTKSTLKFLPNPSTLKVLQVLSSGGMILRLWSVLGRDVACLRTSGDILEAIS